MLYVRQLARQKTEKIATQCEKSLRLRNFANFVNLVCLKRKIAKNVKFVNLACLERKLVALQKIVKFGTDAKNCKTRCRVQSWI